MSKHEPDERDATLLSRLVAGDPGAREAVVAAASESDSVSLLAAAALVSRDGRTLGRATELAATPRERQLVALADADLRGETDLLDALVRDHLAEHPDHLLAAWIASNAAGHDTDKEISS